MASTSPSYVDKVESGLDKFLSSSGKKCKLVDCTPGKIWLVIAAISLLLSAQQGAKAFAGTFAWEVMIGFAVSWLCRSCGYGWLWTMLVLMAAIPALVVAAIIAVIFKGAEAIEK